MSQKKLSTTELLLRARALQLFRARVLEHTMRAAHEISRNNFTGAMTQLFDALYWKDEFDALHTEIQNNPPSVAAKNNRDFNLYNSLLDCTDGVPA